jgi:hypothetical protein
MSKDVINVDGSTSGNQNLDSITINIGNFTITKDGNSEVVGHFQYETDVLVNNVGNDDDFRDIKKY